ncbi:MAG: hypothetical protein AAB596_02245 [Patescibacteria group bacterium]
MSSIQERIQVNAAIEKLIARDDKNGEAAQILIAFSCKLPITGKIIRIEYLRTTKNDIDVTGYTQEAGNISVKDNHKKTREWSYGAEKERIGKYKLWKPKEGILWFHNFWKSDIATQESDGRMPDHYCLVYDEGTRKLKYFAIERKKTVLSFWFFGYRIKLVKYYLERIYGETTCDGYGSISICILNY